MKSQSEGEETDQSLARFVFSCDFFIMIARFAFNDLAGAPLIYDGLTSPGAAAREPAARCRNCNRVSI